MYGTMTEHYLKTHLNELNMVLNNDEAKELHMLMDGIIDIPYTDVIKKIIKDKWAVRSKFRYCMEEPHSHDYNLYDGMISHFELNRVIIEMSTTCPLNCKFCHTKEKPINSSCFCKKRTISHKILITVFHTSSTDNSFTPSFGKIRLKKLKYGIK